MRGVVIPNTYIEHVHSPLIFLAGPIMSAPNWQDEAASILLSYEQDLVIASPRRGTRPSIQTYLLLGNEQYFPRQRAWERYYLPIAAHTGAILFWLPGEEHHHCDKVYGAMTRIELGQWMTNYRHDRSTRICIGSDGRFPELHTIAYDLLLDAPDIPIHSTLEETCEAAIHLVKR